jgi:spermidine synthase
MDIPLEADRPVIVERLATEVGEWVLRRAGGHFEVICDGMFLMDTRNGESERALVTAPVAEAGTAGGAGGAGGAETILIGGLGVGFSVEAALDLPGVRRVTVVEISEDVVRWNRTHFSARMGHRLADPRLSVVSGDLAGYLAEPGPAFDVVCLDIDNGPDWLSLPRNGRLYTDGGIRLLAGRLSGHGVLAIWSHARSDALETVLRGHFASVSTLEIEVPKGDPDLIYLARR